MPNLVKDWLVQTRPLRGYNYANIFHTSFPLKPFSNKQDCKACTNGNIGMKEGTVFILLKQSDSTNYKISARIF